MSGTVRRVKQEDRLRRIGMPPNAEVEGYGAYKPVPPPKPVSSSACHSPPPYRMPPYPLYGETAIPGAAASEAAGASTTALHTHSSKFPIEREVILSSADKNSKIPILHEYKKQRPKSIAPEGPNKQVAWTEEKKLAMYNSAISTGAVPRTWTGSGMGRAPQTLPPTVQAEGSGTLDKNKPFPSRTYHTIKDMISSRFGNGKVPKDVDGFGGGDKAELAPAPVLNNTPEASMPNRRKENAEDKQNTQIVQASVYHATGRRDMSDYSAARRDMGEGMAFHNVSRRDVMDGLPHNIQRREAIDAINSQLSRRDGAEGLSQSVSRRDVNEGLGSGMAQTVQRRDVNEGLPQSASRRDVNEGLATGLQHSASRRDVNEGLGTGLNQSASRRDVNDGLGSGMAQSASRRDVNDGLGSGVQRRDVNETASTGMPQSASRRDLSDGLGPGLPQSVQRRDMSDGLAARRDTADGLSAMRRDAGEGVSFHNIGRRDTVEGAQGSFHTAHVAAFHSPPVPGRRDGYSRTLEQAGIYMVMRQNQHPRPQTEGGNYGSPNTVALAKQDDDEDDGGFKILRGSGQSESAPGQQQSSGQSSDYEKATQRSNADSGRGSTIYSSGHQVAQASERLDTSTESSDSPQALSGGIYAGLATANDSEWVDIVESELRQILDPKMHGLGHGVPPAGANSTLSESISSMSPPLPPLSPGGGSSPSVSPQQSARYKHSSRKSAQTAVINKARSANTSRGGWGSKTQSTSEKQHRQSSKKSDKMPLSPSVFGLDTTDLTSTTTGLDSMLDGNTENNSSDDDLSTTIDATDAHAIRKQLEGLENMYSEVLKLLGVKKYGGRYQPSDPRINKRRLYGSMSSLPSSVSSRPIRDKRRQDERKKVKDIKGINKRFQRLESHVVTLARSVAHLSSEMRTQHLMIQEMENIRGEISALRSQTLASRSQSMPRGLNTALTSTDLPALTNPTRVKKLTKFFGDEPPLLRLFLKKLGYEKYAGTFEQERVGMVELPYLTEERLQKMGIPLGPRLRILQEAQISVCRDKVYVV